MLNCTVDSYKRGIINAGSNDVNIDKFDLNAIYATNITGDGGGFIDFRGKSSAAHIGTFSITNSTFDGGIREFIRCDSNYTVDEFTFDHNTCNAITSASDSYGVFYMRCTFSGPVEVTNNLWLNLADSYVHGVSGRYVMGATAFAPTTSSGNYWYNAGKEIAKVTNTETKAQELTIEDSQNIFGTGWPFSVAIPGVGYYLDNDPCYDSTRGNFYITDQTVYENGVGDPRWLADYVKPEEEVLEVVEPGTEWDCTDTKTFYDEADETVVHGNLKFIVEDNPIQISEDGIYFTSKSTLMTYSGMPTDCALAFLVDRPGSVVVSTTGGWNSQIEVSYAPYDASTGLISSTFTTVAGSASAGSNSVYISPVNIPEEGALNYPSDGVVYIVYIYVSSPMYLTSLAWVEDIAPAAATSLETPENLAIDIESFVIGQETQVNLTWDDVLGAGSYSLYSVTEDANGDAVYTAITTGLTTPQYTVDVSAYAIGTYNFAVQANTFSGSIRTDSAISEAVTLTIESNWSAVPDNAVTTWDPAYWEELSAGGDITTDTVTEDGLLHFCINDTGDGKSVNGFKFAKTNMNSEAGSTYRCQIASSGAWNKNAFQIKVTTNGTLTLTCVSSGSGDRQLNVAVNEKDLDVSAAAPTSGSDAETTEITIDNITGESTISVYSPSSGVNVFYMIWTPASVN